MEHATKRCCRGSGNPSWGRRYLGDVRQRQGGQIRGRLAGSLSGGRRGVITHRRHPTNSSDLLLTPWQYASKIYDVNHADGTAEDGDSDKGEGDIETEIKKELDGIRNPARNPLFTSVRLDTQCCKLKPPLLIEMFDHTDCPVVFFKTRQPVEPVSLIQKICQDAANGVEQKRCRFVKRLTPITAIEKATDRGLDEAAQQVLAPHFHGPDRVGKKVGFLFLLPHVRCR